jgi:hypothetical protein
MNNSVFFEALAASGPHPSLGPQAETYGRFIGSWTGEVRDFADDGTRTVGRVEIHFRWVLDGRAVQDLWISPTRAELAAGKSPSNRWRYGTTIRMFRPATSDWQVVWFNPVTGARNDLVGHLQGDQVVQLGLRDGTPIRWTFSKITPGSFLWQGHSLEADGASWQLEAEFCVERTA